MDLNKFTERARGFVQAAQTIALREGHQRLAPEHILKALMDDDQGLASNLIKRAGGAPERVVEALEAGELYIITHASYVPMVSSRFRGIEEAFERARDSAVMSSVDVPPMPDFSG